MKRISCNTEPKAALRAALKVGAVGALTTLFSTGFSIGQTPILTSTAHAQFYAAPVTVVVNGSVVPTDVAPIVESGRTLVPLRGVLEALGANVTYEPASRTVLAARGGTTIRLPIGSRTALVNGAARTLDTPARVVSGRTLVPLRFMSEALGASVSYSPASRLITISTGGAVNPGVGVNFPGGTALPAGQYITLSGTVRRNLPGNQLFEVVTDSGVIVEVRPRVAEPSGLSAGDAVEISGQYVANSFYADRVRIVRDTQRRVTRDVTVVQVLSNNRLIVQDLRGRRLTVVTTTPLNTAISAGDRVRVVGDLNNRTVNQATVTLTRNLSNPTQTGQNVDFGATVVALDANSDLLQVRGANGTIYLVRYNGFERFNIGDRIRVQGFYANGITTATAIRRN